MYSDLTADELVALLVSGSKSIEEQHPVPVNDEVGHENDTSTNYFEVYPMHHGENNIDNLIRGATGDKDVQNQYPSTGYHEELSIRVDQVDLSGQVNDQIDDQVIETDHATNTTGTSSNAKVARRRYTRTTR